MASAGYKERVNTEGINASTLKLRNVQNNINSMFEKLTNNSNGLERSWRSPAGDAAVSKLYEIFKGSGSLSTVLQNYINLLEQQVSAGYENAEKVNNSLADKFK